MKRVMKWVEKSESKYAEVRGIATLQLNHLAADDKMAA